MKTKEKTLPRNLAATQLGFESPDPVIGAFPVVTDPKPPPYQSRRNSQDQPRRNSRSFERKNTQRNFSKSPSGNRYNSRGRKTEKKGDKKYDKKGGISARERSNSRYSSASKSKSSSASRHSSYSGRSSPASRSSSTASLNGQLRAVQYHTSFSRSKNRKQKVPMRSLFRNRSDSNSSALWEQSYFLETPNSERFKDVQKTGNCLRCYSNKHKARDCRRFTKPCPSPCPACKYLYHEHRECHVYDMQGNEKQKNVRRM